jgi:periplasmic copper chaperone A
MLKWLSVFAGIGVIVLGTGAFAHEIKHKAITLVHPWVLETEQPEAVLHVKIKNAGEATERLLRASTPLASKASIVDPLSQDVTTLSIPGRGELVLRTDGPHIVLSGLKVPLRAYDSFALTLVFEKAGSVNVEVSVEEQTSDKPGGG